jgi:phosphotriesterase-related protein
MLPHEHVMVSLAVPGPYDPGSPALPDRYRYDRDEVVRAVLPHLRAAHGAGIRTLAEATPAYLGRDPVLLKRLSEASGIRLLTNTGYYGAREDEHIPQHARGASAEELAARWTREFRDGIGDTGIRPGFIKIGVDARRLSALDATLVRAAALTHCATGLTIACHTGPAVAAWDVLGAIEREGVPASAWIWVHAQAETDRAAHVEAARRGAWVEFDGVSEETLEDHVALVMHMRGAGRLDRVLISQDAGWYRIGEPGGGAFRGYTVLPGVLVPALRRAGLSEDDVQRLTRTNPAAAYGVRLG